MILDMIQGCRYLQRSTDRWLLSKNSMTRLEGLESWHRAGLLRNCSIPITNIKGSYLYLCVDAKSAPSAKHTASRTSWLHTCKESRYVPVNFSWKLTKDKEVRYQSLELAGWYQTVPYLRLRSQMKWHIAMKSYLPINWNHSGTCKGEKVILPNGWRKHDCYRSLFEQRCTCTRPWPIPMKISIK
jgi:hypothetical protein